MSNFYHITGGILTAFGLLSIISGVIAFFPVLSYKPLFIGWSVRIACPIWNGALAFSVGVLALLSYREWTQRSLWESTFTLGLLSIIGSPVQFSLAIASILIGPYCYYTFAGMSSTNYIGYAIKFPFPYTKFQNVCQDPLHYESYHLALQTIDLLSSVLIFCSSLALVIRLSARILRTGTFNMFCIHCCFCLVTVTVYMNNENIIWFSREEDKFGEEGSTLNVTHKES